MMFLKKDLRCFLDVLGLCLIKADWKDGLFNGFQRQMRYFLGMKAMATNLLNACSVVISLVRRESIVEIVPEWILIPCNPADYGFL